VEDSCENNNKPLTLIQDGGSMLWHLDVLNVLKSCVGLISLVTFYRLLFKHLSRITTCFGHIRPSPGHI
jgi:hypothetical protein